MSIATGVTTRCSRAGAQVMRQGRHLAADAVDTYRAGALLLRGSPFAVGWFAGWLSAEFSPQVVTGQVLSRVTHPSVGRVATQLGRRSGRTRFSPRRSRSRSGRTTATWCATPAPIRSAVPAVGDSCRWRGIAAVMAQTSNIAYGPGGRDNLLDMWRQPDLPKQGRVPVLVQVPGGAWAVNGKRGQAYR